MKDMKNRVWRAISAVAMREHWRVRRVLLLVMVAVTALSMVTVKSMGDTVQPRRDGDHLRPPQPGQELRYSGDPGGL